MTTKKEPRLKIPPQHLESEQALLGAIMLRPEGVYEIMDIISGESFYAEKHRMIFKSMMELFQKNEPIDMLSLSAKLTEKNMLQNVGGRGYLAELVHSVPSATNIKYYAEIIQKKSMLRRLIEAAERIHDLGYGDDGELDEILDQAEKKVYEVTNSGTVHKFIDIKDTLTDAWERIDALHKAGTGLRGVSTGFKDLDNMLSGFQPSDLIILAARPSMGKTALALDIARQAAVQDNTAVGIFSLEMSSGQLVDRMLSAEARVNSWKLRTGKLSRDEDFGNLRNALDKLATAPIYIDDQPANNILKMRSVARRLKSEKGLGLIVVDYLQLMSPTQSKNNDNVVQQITEISRSLKQLARELKVPVLALSQLSRDVEKRGGSGRPKLSDLRDSGSIEQDADVVMFIHREDKYRETADGKNIAQIHVDKHRNGPVGSIELFFDEERTTFLNLDKSNIADFMKEDGVF
ncbi:MAG: replicative helicase [Patescibacteria group bacterium]|jgi:replicative DNA helicase|nr:replicative helicase [Patescibacteria group bacterium]